MMTPSTDKLVELLKPERITIVVDIGANAIDGEPPYKSLLQKGLCRVIGFYVHFGLVHGG